MIEQSNHGYRYRPEIDGLRALAVLPVVFFHAHVPGFGGGFVGVDVFFVISGFLITSILVRDLDQQQFSIAKFYERRIRRILPALTVMALATTIAAFVLLTPRELIQFARSLSATALFYSNFFFATQTGYFDGPATSRPLLHTWSLGVEEQFYIVWPLLLLLAYKARLNRKTLGALILAFAAGSLIVAQFGLTGARSARYFYLPQARAWELLLGALLAIRIVPPLRSQLLRDTLGLLGIALVIFSVIMFSAATPFPSFWTLIPCLGSLLFIYVCDSGDNVSARILSFSPLVFIGLISYSLYLWHWPLFVYLNILFQESISVYISAGAIAASFLLATLSYYIVERPFRTGANSHKASYRHIFAGISVIVITALVGGGLLYLRGVPSRLDLVTLRFYEAAKAVNPLRRTCHTEADIPAPDADCISPKPRNSQQFDILVWGDSHADAFFPAIGSLAAHWNLYARQASKSGCPPALGVERVDRRSGEDSVLNCSKFNDAVLKQLADAHRPKLVVLAARWTLYTEQNDRQGTFLVDVESGKGSSDTPAEVLRNAVGRTVSALNKMGLDVLLVGQAPEFGRDPNRCVVQKRMRRQLTEPCVTRNRSSVEQRLAASNAILMDIAANIPNTKVLQLHEFFCESKLCFASRNGDPLYSDGSHIGLFAARAIGDMLSGNDHKHLFSALIPTRQVEPARAQ